MNPLSNIYVAGHRGMVGAAVVREIARLGLPAPITATHAELDLTDQAAARAFMLSLAAADLAVAQAEARARPATEFTDAHATLRDEDRGEHGVAGERMRRPAVERERDARAVAFGEAHELCAVVRGIEGTGSGNGHQCWPIRMRFRP